MSNPSQNSIDGSAIKVEGDFRLGNDYITEEERLPKLIGNPVSPPVVFIGREDDLKELNKYFFKYDNKIILVSGEGGLGKTALVSSYFNNFEKRYKNCIWVSAENSLLEGMFSLENDLGIAFTSEMSIDERLKKILLKLRTIPKNGLLIIDNANDFKELRKYYKDLKTCNNFHILITTRISNLEKANIYEIKSLMADDAKQLFKEHLQAYTVDNDNKLSLEEEIILDKILIAVGYNTLVIEILAKNLNKINHPNQTFYSLADLLKNLENNKLLNLSLEREISVDWETKDDVIPSAIIETMYDLRGLNAYQIKVLSNFSVLPAEEITYQTLKTLLIPKDLLLFSETLKILNFSGWIKMYRKEEKIGYKISNVIQEVISKKNKYLLRDCQELIISLTEKLAYQQETGAVIYIDNQMITKYVQYAENLLDIFSEANDDLMRLMEKVGNYHNITGNLDKALGYFTRYSTLAKKFLSSDENCEKHKTEMAISYLQLGLVQVNKNDFEMALKYFKRFQKLAKKLNKIHKNNNTKHLICISKEKLGSTYLELENYGEALKYFTKYHKLTKKLHRKDKTNGNFKNSFAISHEKLGAIYFVQEDTDEALKLFEKYHQLIEELTQTYPENSNLQKSLAIAYEKLGSAYLDLGKWNKAEQAFLSFNERTKKLKEANPVNINLKNYLAISYERLGSCYFAKADLEKALTFFDKYLDGVKKLNEEYPKNISFQFKLVEAYKRLGETYFEQTNFISAQKSFEDYHEESIRLYKEYQNNLNAKYEIAISCEKLGGIYSKQNKTNDALNYFTKSNKLFVQLMKAKPKAILYASELAASYQWLGWFWEENLDEFNEAKKYYLKSHHILSKLIKKFPKNIDLKNDLEWVNERLSGYLGGGSISNISLPKK